MNILRLSLFKLKKNKKEAVAIAFLTMITTLMLAVFMANISKANKAYEDSFAQAGSKDTCVMIKKDKFRDEYRRILEEDYGITDITEAEAIYASALDYKNKDGEDRTYVVVVAHHHHCLALGRQALSVNADTFLMGNRGVKVKMAPHRNLASVHAP